MKKFLLISIMLAAIAGLYSCKSQFKTKNAMITDTHTSQNSLDWDGIYRGVLPCADCEGIQKIIYLNKDGSYRVRTEYLGKQDSAGDYSGKLSWNKEGNTVILQEAGDQKISYLVGENTLTQLDMNGRKITGELAGKYILSKEHR